MVYTIDNCTINRDSAATRAYYTEHPAHNSCTCSGCKNFREYSKMFPAEVKDFFSSVGISDMRVIAEIIPHITLDDGLLFYGGFFHVVGTMTNAPEFTQEVPCYESSTDADGKRTFVKTGTEKRTWYETAFRKLTDSFEIMFSDSTALVPDDFPRPVLQLDINAHIPWVIDEENTY